MSQVYKSVPVKSSEITSYAQYLSRREFLKAADILTGSAVLAACAPKNNTIEQDTAKTDELGDPLTPLNDVTHYNNYYEFSERKESVASLAKNFKPKPWTVEVSGLVNKPQTYGIEDLLARFPQEERIYRLRCIESWSM